MNLNQTAIAVLGFSGRYSLGDDGAFGVFTQMNHLGSRIGLLIIVGQGDGVKLPYGVVAFKNTRRVFPSYSRTCFYLSP